jgi:RNA-directed DNA polymerase
MGVSLTTPESVWQLQETLRAKAKREPACRFHSLYDKLYREDVLLHAWRCCRANGGAPGVDGVSFEQIEREGVNGWLRELVRELQGKTYRPQAVRRVGYLSPGPTSRGRWECPV